MKYSTVRESLENGNYPALRPIVFSGGVGVGKYSASLDAASTFALEKNIFSIEMANEEASVDDVVYSDINIQKIMSGERVQSPLIHAIEVANEGEPSVVIYDLIGEGKINNKFASDLLDFINSGVCESYKLEKGNENNLVIMIVKSDELELSDSLERRCLKVCDFVMTDVKTKSI